MIKGLFGIANGINADFEEMNWPEPGKRWNDKQDGLLIVNLFNNMPMLLTGSLCDGNKLKIKLKIQSFNLKTKFFLIIKIFIVFTNFFIITDLYKV